MFMPIRVEVAARAKRAARALDEDLIATLGKKSPIEQAEEARAPIRAAHQDGGQALAATGDVVVCQQHDAIGHGYLQVTFDGDGMRFGRRQFGSDANKAAYQRHSDAP